MGPGSPLLEGGVGDDASYRTVADFDGRGALAGDELLFSGYGAGATFMKTSANTGKISYLGGTEFLTFSNGAAVDAGDYTFI